jgi:hypothetical protein
MRDIVPQIAASMTPLGASLHTRNTGNSDEDLYLEFRLKSGGLLGSAGDDDDRALIELVTKVKTPAGLPTRKQFLELVAGRD